MRESMEVYMKKFVAAALAAVMVLGTVGCGAKEETAATQDITCSSRNL